MERERGQEGGKWNELERVGRKREREREGRERDRKFILEVTC